jgi:hypothetical protein
VRILVVQHFAINEFELNTAKSLAAGINSDERRNKQVNEFLKDIQRTYDAMIAS